MATFIPGYQAGLTINVIDLGVFGNVLSVRRSKTAPKKPVFGQQEQQVISGQTSGSLSASGHLASEGPLVGLWAMFEAETSVAYSIQVGSGATDAGTFAGNMVVTSLEVSTDAEGEFQWSLSGDFDGAITHTP